MPIQDFEEIVVLEPHLRSLGSHHCQLDSSIARAAARAGLKARFVSHLQATSEVRDALHPTPAFADITGWQRRLAAAWPFRSLPPQFTGLAAHELEARQRQRELAPVFRSWDSSRRLVLVPECVPALNDTVSRVLRRDPRPGLTVVLVFPYPAGRFLGKRTLRTLRPLVEAGQVVLTTTSEPLAEYYRALSGLPFAALPWPLELPAPAPEAPVPAAGGPVRFLAVGGFRLEKGIDLLARSIEDLTAQIDAGKLAFTIQGFPNPLVPDPEANRYFDLLQAFAAKHPGVRIIDRALDPQGPEYRQLYADSDAVLVPYRRGGYDLRISAVLIEALALGKPVVTTAGTCMDHQVRGSGAAVLCDDGDASSLTQAILRLAADLPAYAAAARQHREGWRSYHHPDTYLRIIGSLVDAAASQSSRR